MKLVEMSTGLNTSEDTFRRAWAFCESLGQQPVRTQDTPGFILNYFLIPYNNDAIRLVEQGNEVHVAYMTSGNIAVFDHDAWRFADFVVEFNRLFGIEEDNQCAYALGRRRPVLIGSPYRDPVPAEVRAARVW